MKTIERYKIFEISHPTEDSSGDMTAVFRMGDYVKEVRGFENGEQKCTIRFMPHLIGNWEYELFDVNNVIKGEFACVSGSGNNHGPIRKEGFHFRYGDGGRYIPFGTTCYAWIHQSPEVMEQTIDTLKQSPFNKIRMCVFPKHMAYNNNEPAYYPFHKDESGKWDVLRPDNLFWENLEQQIQRLDKLGIEADLILFHPYDRWGFSEFSQEESLIYLEYCVRRLSAYKNIWWSLANEYDLMASKTEEDWDAYAETIRREEVYPHMLSIHNCLKEYPKRDWMTHCSIQTTDTGKALFYRQQYQLPVIIDECGYEGNIEFIWGNLSAFEMVHRFWMTMTRGGYCTHGETFVNEDEVLWWAKGGRLQGESQQRIAFLKDILEEFSVDMEPVNLQPPSDPNSLEEILDNPFTIALRKLSEQQIGEWMLVNTPMICGNEEGKLIYLGRSCPAWYDIELPALESYTIEVIDIWKMIRNKAFVDVQGRTRLKLPAKEGIAILIKKNC